MGCCCLSHDRVKLTVNSKKETNSRVKMGQGSRCASVLSPDRVKLAVSSRKETNSRVKMGKESRLASVIYPLKKSKWDRGHYQLLLFTPWQSQTDSEQQGQDGLVLFSPWQSTGRPGKDEIWKIKDLQLLHVTIPSFYWLMLFISMLESMHI